ncbi:hypothetical protein [Streptosporangium sp. KLBMP 9127]|nr:hypothetical protein [Streptosporangium sp. KLBMP 9127]
MSQEIAPPRTGLIPGIVAGLVAALVGAAAYGTLIAVTEAQIGIAAVGVGVVVGLAVTAVKPTSPVLPALAALFALIACALGQIGGLTALYMKATNDDDYVRSFTQTVNLFGEIVGEDPMTLLFWAISAFAGFGFVNRRVKAAVAARSASEQPAAQPRGPFEAAATGSAKTPVADAPAFPLPPARPFPGPPQTPHDGK